MGSKLCLTLTKLLFNMSLTTWHFRNRQIICIVHVGNTNVEHEQMKIVQYLEESKSYNKRPMGHIAHMRNQFKSMNTFERNYDYTVYIIKLAQ